MAHGSHRLAANSRAHALTVSLGAGVHLPLASRCVHILLSTLSCARDPCPAPRLICRPHPRPRRISGRSPLSHPPLLHALSHASLRFTPSSTRLRQRSHARSQSNSTPVLTLLPLRRGSAAASPLPPFSCQGARAIPAQRALRGCCLPTAPFFQWAGSRAPLWEELPLGIGADDEFCGTRGLDEGKPRGSA